LFVFVCVMFTFKRFLRRPSNWLGASTAALTWVLCLALALVPVLPARAQWRASEDAEVCVTGTGVRSLDVAVCGRALGREDLSDLDRASVLTARGKAYRDSGQPALALMDFDAALALNPYSASALYERALTLEASGNHERALEDFRHAIALSPRFAPALKNRGVAHFYAGNLECARADLDAALVLARNDGEIHAFRGFLHYLAGRFQDAAEDFHRVHSLGLPYTYLPLWHYLAGSETAATGRTALAAEHAALLPGEWPRPLLEAYLGLVSPETLIATLGDDRGSPGLRRRLAETHYYLAALERLNGRREPALGHLAKTLALSERAVPERVMAEHQLAAVGGKPSSSREADC
jgi:lipoprotein NlpI